MKEESWFVMSYSKNRVRNTPRRTQAQTYQVPHSRGGGGAMIFQPCLEELEERSLPSAADLFPLQQSTTLVPLQSQFLTSIAIVQSTLQANLNNAEALASTLPPQFQLLLSGVFAQDQLFVNAFPALAAISFEQILLTYEANLLAASSNSFAFFGAGFAPGFFPFGFGALGYGGFGALGGYGGGAFTSGFSGGSSGFSGGSFGSASPFVGGPGMGGGIMSTVGALTLPPSNNSSAGGDNL
jgi:hypothetical protein